MLFQQIAMTVAEGGEHELAPLWAEPWVFGAVTFAILLVMMFVTLSYTNLGNRHAAVEEHADPHRQHPNKHDHGQGH
jgi:cytochrome c-type biogenesis protein CcmH/NrfG